MNEQELKKPRATRVIVGDMPPAKATKQDKPVQVVPQVQDDGWKQAARGSKPGDRYVRACGPKEAKRRGQSYAVQSRVSPESQSTWGRFRAWLRAHRF